MRDKYYFMRGNNNNKRERGDWMKRFDDEEMIDNLE